MADLTEATALVTGAARRLGKAIAWALHERGFRVAVHHHKSEHAALELVEQMNQARAGSAVAIAADLAARHAPVAVVEAVLRRFGRLDCLVNNAAVFPATQLATTTREEFDALISVNLAAPYFLGQCAAPFLAAAPGGGTIVNLVDIHGMRPLAGHSVYSVTKAALIMATKALAKELAPQVRVNGVAPGAILWPEEQEAILEKVALGRPGRVEDVVAAVLYLVQDAPYVTGEILAVDGGRLLHS